MFYLFDVTKTAKNYGTVPTKKKNGNYKHSSLDDSENGHSSQDDLENSNDHDKLLNINRRRPYDNDEQLLNIDEALQRLGMGVFQYRIMLSTGLFLAADSCEVVVLSFLSHVIQSHYNWSREFTNNGFSEGDAYDTDTTDGGDTLSTLVLPGAIIGSILWGIFGDFYGRRITFLAMAIIVSIFGVATSFVTSYKWLVFARIMVSFGISGLTVPFNTCAELMPPNARGKQLVLLQVFWTAGALAVHLALQQQEQESIADSPQQSKWRLIAGLCAIPSVIASILAWLFVPESPRWLLANGNHDIALALLRQGAYMNGKDPYETFPEGTILFSHEPEEVTSTPSQCFNLCSPGWMTITAALITTYFGKAFLDHGTVSMAVTVFSNDERQQDYQALFSASSEFIGLLLVYFTIDKLGRATSQCLGYASVGIICLSLALIGDYDSTINPNILLLLAFLAHLFVNSATTATWISTTEVLATAIRTTGHGLSHSVARIGGALSTYVLARIYSIPTVGLILFVSSIWTASASSKLPDTSVKEMGVVHYPSRRRSTSRRRPRRCTAASNTATRPSNNNHDDTVI